MMRESPLYLSKLTLKDAPEVAAVKATLLPPDPDAAMATDHRLVWSAFAAEPTDARRFLWRRQDASGRYLALSSTAPTRDNPLFQVETKLFEPQLSHGDRLGFQLRVNATVDRREGGRSGRRIRSDVAMDLLKPVSKGGRERARHRQELAEAGAKAWLEARASRDGFELGALRLEGYRAARAPRRGERPAVFGVFDLEGLLTVVDPAAFLTRLAAGFGRAKAFGCGLMLVRRAPQ